MPGGLIWLYMLWLCYVMLYILSSSEIPTPTYNLQILLFVNQAMGFSGGSGVERENRKKGDKPVVPAINDTKKRLILCLL